MNARLRRIRLGLRTLFSDRPQGFFLPYRYADYTAPTEYRALVPIFAQAHCRFVDLIVQMNGFADQFAEFGGEPPNPRFEQDWFPRLDAAAAYTIVRCMQPSTIIEIGSGHSTRVMAKAIRDGNAIAEIVCIDPAPRAPFHGLPVRHIARPLQTVDLSDLPTLASGDVMFVDSSHIAMPGTDVDHIINTLLPGLPAGCLVHFHDVFLPDGYPLKWSWRGYNEQIAVGALIQSGAFEILFASRYVVERQAELFSGSVIERLPLMDGAVESSLWLRKLNVADYSAYQNVSGR